MKKRITINNYNIFNKRAGDKDLKIVLISDIHYSSLTDIDNLYQLKNNIGKLDPNYICVAGDIIDCLNFVSDKILMKKFYDWIHNLGNINDKTIPVLVSLGNHDMSFKKNKLNRDNSIYNEYFKNLKGSNTYILDNSYYEDEYVFITGFTQPKDSFHNIDSLKIEKDYYNKLNYKLLSPNNKKIKIALIHSPINLTNKHIAYKLRNYDLILSGHMHNGMIPSFIEKVLKGNSGIIEPNKKLFPKLARGIVKLDENRYLIISGGITKLGWTSGILHYGNVIYPMHIENITITNKKLD